MRQEIVYFPHPNNLGEPPGKVEVGPCPDRVWVIPNSILDGMEPGPITPQHGRNAMLQDRGHDWYWNKGWLKFNGPGEAYLLLEYDGEDEDDA